MAKIPTFCKADKIWAILHIVRLFCKWNLVSEHFDFTTAIWYTNLPTSWFYTPVLSIDSDIIMYKNIYINI